MVNLTYPENLTGDHSISTGVAVITANEYKFIDIMDDELGIKQGATLGTIKLYIPGGIGESYGISYSNEEMGIFALMGSKSTKQAIISAINNKFGKTKQARQYMAMKTGKGLMPNDMKLFTSSDNTSFSLTYKLVPRNHKEGTTILKIIDAFKRWALPVQLKGPQGFVLIQFPAVFNIQLLRRTNSSSTKISSKDVSNIIKNYHYMGLTQLDIQHSPDSNSYLSFDDGVPVSIQLTLGFTSILPPRIKDDRMSGEIL